MKFSHSKLIVLSGAIWFTIGVYLLQLGLNLLIGGVNADMSAKSFYPLINFLNPYIGSVESTSILLLVVALFIGYVKGRYVLGKTAQKGVKRILSFPNPTKISNLYNGKYYLLMGLMVGLGISIKFLGISHDIRGVVDIAIGSALINGSIIYFRLSQTAKAPCHQNQ
jgi:hypothetical protein